MKNRYETPEMEILLLKSEDIICSSSDEDESPIIPD